MVPAGFLSEACGLKGLRVGGAQVSEKHANFLINAGGATAADLRTLACRVKARGAGALRRDFGRRSPVCRRLEKLAEAADIFNGDIVQGE